MALLKNNEVIIEIIIGIEYKMGLTLIAEGIETEEQLNIVAQVEYGMPQSIFSTKLLAYKPSKTTYQRNKRALFVINRNY